MFLRVQARPLGDLVRVAAEDALHLLVFRLLLGDLLVQRFQLRTLGADGDLIGNVGCQHAEQHQHKKQPDQRFAKRTLPALFAALICHCTRPHLRSRHTASLLLL